MEHANGSLASVHTRAGRTIDVAVLTLPGTPIPGAVTVSMRCASFDDHEHLWLSLSAAEASSLAGALAQAVEQLAAR